MNTYDLTIVGGGIIGLATALEIAQSYPRVRLLVLEKEGELAAHQTGHNSGVIHSGIYYRPGSTKAQTCVAGRKALIRFCEQNGIPYELCGKVVVATREDELPRLEELQRRGTLNGVEGLEMIGPERLKEIEPHARGLKALRVPAAGIVDFREVARAFAAKVAALGGEILTSREVKNIGHRGGMLRIETSAGEFGAKYLVNCAGLFSDVFPRTMGDAERAAPRIIPFRGEYYRIVPERAFLVHALIYPVPDPELPFLGVHFGRTIHGEVRIGPNAILALAREGYRRSDIDLSHLLALVSYRGFWRLALRHWKTGLKEILRSASKGIFLRDARRLVPELRARDLVPGGSGVRAQAVSPSGALIDDFVITQTGNTIHVLNAPSPGATASLAIGKRIAGIAAKAFSLQA